ncbi:TPA: helix-turn-helix domain-containing protein [Candidatus Micrarchaeota archaeon]|nr:helix-turn-helix domain-containing protein [Candidatus Micrarchaeota archaeon]
MEKRKLYALVGLLMDERLSVREAADVIGVSHMTAYRALQNSET